MENLKVKYHERTFDIGFRDGAYFQARDESKKTRPGTGYTAYWLTDHEGNRAPESVYVALVDGLTGEGMEKPIQEYAALFCDGNFSLAVRQLISKGLKV